MKVYLKEELGNGLPNDPEKYIPSKPDKDPDPTKKKNDPTKINEPEKNDPTRIDDPSPDKSKENTCNFFN